MGRVLQTSEMKLLAVLFLCGSAAKMGARAAATQRPNILFIMADQFRYDAIRSGGPLATPNLARLASEGATFTSMYSSTPTCTPAREAILTGRAPWNRGMLGYGAVADYPWEGVRTLAKGGIALQQLEKSFWLE